MNLHHRLARSMDAYQQAACAMMLQLNCSYEQACGIMSNAPHDVVDRMRTIGAPNYGNFWAHNSTTSRAPLFVEDPRPERVQSKPDSLQSLKYTPRSTNVSMDANKKKIASKDMTIEILTKRVNELEEEKAAMGWIQTPLEEVVKEAKEESKEEVPRFKMERAARLPVKPIYVIAK